MNYTVEKTKKELFELLDSNPKLRSYQKSLSEAMDTVEEKDRLKVLGVYLQHNLSDLLFEMMELRRLLNERNN